MQYLWSKKIIVIYIKIKLFWFESVWNVIFRILKNQYLT